MMACKCAVVDLNRETVRGVLEHQVNALLAEPTPEAIADAVVRLLDDEPLRQRLVETAYRQVQQLSWEKSARRVEEILYAKLPAMRRALSPYRFEAQPGLPALVDMPVEQRRRLDNIHRQRRRLREQWKAIARQCVRWLSQIGQNPGLDGAPVQRMEGITAKRYIGQTFVARRDNLHRVDVLVSTYDRRNTRDVIFHLKESPTASDDLVTVCLNASLLTNDDYAHFIFEPQVGSSGKSFYFCIESPESVRGDAVALWAYRQVDLPDTRLYCNGRLCDGCLVFGTFYLDDVLGEIGERPSPHGFGQLATFWHRLGKAYHLFSSRNFSVLMREATNYLKWKVEKL